MILFSIIFGEVELCGHWTAQRESQVMNRGQQHLRTSDVCSQRQMKMMREPQIALRLKKFLNRFV